MTATKIKFLTLGCKVNQYETQALKEQCASRGLIETDGIANIYVINACTVTNRADAKSREAIARAKRSNPQAKIAVCGCMTQLDAEKIKKLGVDYVIPQEKKHQLIDIIAPLDGKQEIEFNSKPGVGSIWTLRIRDFKNKRAFIKVQDGCSNACSFCKIPYVRGKSLSRPKEKVLEEISRISLTHPEIVLCGVNLGLYGKDLHPNFNLYSLVKEILKIPSLGRLRLSSLEPNLIDDKLLSLFTHRKLCPHLHLPFQSGDDRVLKAMNKSETVGLYETLVKKMRSGQPNAAISCDIMVGFPAENEETFENTVRFLKRIQPMRMHIFVFSPREKTKFASISMQKSALINKRAKLLKGLALRLADTYAKTFLNTVLHMVTEEKKGAYTYGYTENYIKVCVHEKVSLGTIVPVTIEQIDGSKVSASCITPEK